MSEYLMEMINVSKKFGGKTILQDINIRIKQGQSIALLGHNGCGKSTLLKIICKLTNIDTGQINYSHKLKFNYVPENFPKMDITAGQYIKHIGLIEGISHNILEQKSTELFHAFFLEDMIDKQMKHLSKGTLQKIGVIQALLTKPDVLLLDEPLSGQDIESQRVFISLIRKLNAQGVTIIMSCHERFLVNMLSNVVYEIKNKNIEKIEMNELSTYEYDILTFLNHKNDRGIKSDIIELVDKVENEHNKTTIVVKRENSNVLIKKMLENEYELRSMYSE